MSSNEINALMIFEILGRPKEHIVETLKSIIKRIGEEPGIKVKEEKINEPKEIKNQQDLFTTFAEIEIEAEEISKLIGIIFRYMPAHIEIISPENLKISNNKLNETFNEIARRLHNYDEVARILQTEKVILENKLKEASERKK